MTNRLHDCRHDTPVTWEYVKIPTDAVCDEPHCYWQRYATDTERESMRDVRALALHHAKALRHHVTIHLRQEVRILPEGQPMATGARPAGMAPDDQAVAS